MTERYEGGRGGVTGRSDDLPVEFHQIRTSTADYVDLLRLLMGSSSVG